MNIVLMTLLATLGLGDGDTGGPDHCGPSEDPRESIQTSDHFIFDAFICLSAGRLIIG